MNNGKLDGLKEKIENSGNSNSVDQAIERQGSSGDSEDVVRLEKRLEKLIEAYREQETIIKDQESTINRQQDEIDQLKRRLNEPVTSTTRPTTTPSRNTESSGGGNSLEDLLREADEALGTSSSSSTPVNRRTIGTWKYSYSGVTGDIEFYEDRGRLFSKVTIDGDTRMDISELQRSGDRFTVTGSRYGEYYELKNNGDLDAFDRNGYQTTCRLQ